MSKLTFDHIFKIGVLLLGVLFIFEIHSYVNNGRYKNFNGQSDYVVLDTRTGLLYDEGSGPRGTPGTFNDRPKRQQ